MRERPWNVCFICDEVIEYWEDGDPPHEPVVSNDPLAWPYHFKHTQDEEQNLIDFGRLVKQRDAALARVAELERVFQCDCDCVCTVPIHPHTNGQCDECYGNHR